MLTPEQIRDMAETMQPLLDNLNAFISQDMIERMMARLGRGEDFMLTGSDVWQAKVFKEAGGHYEALQKEIQKFTGKSDAEVASIFEDAGITAWTADDNFYVSQGLESIQFLKSERMVNILTDAYQRTNGEIHNFTRTTAKASQQRYISVVDAAHIKVMTGAQSYAAAVSDAVNELAEVQTKVQYPTGHIDTIETAVMRAVRTGTAQASGNIALEGMIEHDWDLIRVSSHLGARTGDGGENPGNHFWWQGKLYSRTGRTKDLPKFEEATGYGTGEGLCGWNCRHSFGPGQRNYNPYKEYDSEENQRIYDLTQKQRRYESRIRQSKLKLKGLDTAIKNAQDGELKEKLQENYNKTLELLKRRNEAYNKFCEDNNLKRQAARLEVARKNRTEKVNNAINQSKNNSGVEINAKDANENVQNYKPVKLDDKAIEITRKDNTIITRKVLSAKNDIYVSDSVSLKPKQMSNIDRNVSEVLKLLNISETENLPSIYILNDTEMSSTALASYNPVKNAMFFNEKMGIKSEVIKLQEQFAVKDDERSTYVHEFIHWQDRVEYVKQYGNIKTVSDYDNYIAFRDKKAKKALAKLEKNGYNIKEVSPYASKTYKFEKFDETYTEYRVKQILKG